MEQRERQIRFAVTADGRILETEFCDEEVAGYVDFAVLEDNTVKLLRWPRNTAAVRLPETVGGCLITGLHRLHLLRFIFQKRYGNSLAGVPLFRSVFSVSCMPWLCSGKRWMWVDLWKSGFLIRSAALECMHSGIVTG